MKILLIDAYDSFVHIIYQYLLSLEAQVDVLRNDKVAIAEIEKAGYDLIVLGPGPGHPKDCGYTELLHHFKGKVPLFGVCLGMQAMTLAFGGEVVKAERLMHGKTSQIKHENVGCFRNMPQPFTATRYHSLIAKRDSFPHQELAITAVSLDDGYIMGLKHKHYLIEGVQFHPESICTQDGIKIFQNFLAELEKQN